MTEACAAIQTIPSTVWRNVSTGISWRSMKGNAKSCSWGVITLEPVLTKGQMSGKKPLKKGPQVVDNKLNMSQWYDLTTKQASRVLSCIGKSVACRLKEVIIPFCSALVRHMWSTVPSSCLPGTRESWAYWSEYRRGPWRLLRVWSTRLNKICECSTMSKFRRDLTNALNSCG